MTVFASDYFVFIAICLLLLIIQNILTQDWPALLEHLILFVVSGVCAYKYKDI